MLLLHFRHRERQRRPTCPQAEKTPSSLVPLSSSRHDPVHIQLLEDHYGCNDTEFRKRHATAVWRLDVSPASDPGLSPDWQPRVTMLPALFFSDLKVVCSHPFLTRRHHIDGFQENRPILERISPCVKYERDRARSLPSPKQAASAVSSGRGWHRSPSPH